MLAGIISTKGTTFKFFLLCTFSDLAIPTGRKNPIRGGPAAGTIINFVRLQFHPVLFGTDPGDGDSQRLLSRRIPFQRSQMNRTTSAIQTAICDHIIHDDFYPSSVIGAIYRASILFYGD